MSSAAPAGFERRPKATLRMEDISGGRVRQGFRMGSEYMRPGTILTREQIMAMPYANRVALQDRFIEMFPVLPKAQIKREPVSRFIVHIGAGKFNVIEGVVLNKEPLDKHDAEDLKKQAEAEESSG